MRIFLFAALSLICLTQEGTIRPEPKESPQWYDKVIGVFGVPTAAIGCAYAYLLIRKTRLESRKLELEIEEKRRQLSERAVEHPESLAVPTSVETIEEALRNRLLLLLALRYILWQLVAASYDWLITPIKWLLNVAVVVVAESLQSVIRSAPSPLKYGVIATTTQLPSVLFDLGAFLIFLGFGWPLFKDINATFGIKLSDYRPMHLIRAAFHPVRENKPQ